MQRLVLLLELPDSATLMSIPGQRARVRLSEDTRLDRCRDYGEALLLFAKYDDTEFAITVVDTVMWAARTPPLMLERVDRERLEFLGWEWSQAEKRWYKELVRG